MVRLRSQVASGAPRVRMCISWRYVLLALMLFYLGCLLILLYTLDRLNQQQEDAASPGRDYNDPLQLLNLDISHFVRDIRDEVDQLESDFLVWSGFEDADDPVEESEIVLDQVEIRRLHTIEKELQGKYPDQNLQLCRRLALSPVANQSAERGAGEPSLPSYSSDPLANCRKKRDSKTYYFYNPYSSDRYLCTGSLRVGAEQVLRVPATAFDKKYWCLHDSLLFPAVLPNITALGLPPIALYDNVDPETSNAKPFEDCDIPCEVCGYDNVITKRKIADTPFKFIFSMEGPEYYAALDITLQSWQVDKFYATTSFQSEIPLPYFSFAEYPIQENPPVDYETTIKGALFLARNCGSRNHRENIVQELQELNDIFRVDSLSSCLHNAKPPSGMTLKDKGAVMGKYLFYLAFENQNRTDYITEKLWGAFVAGTVPVYLGAPNARDHVPDHSTIFVQDFKTTKELAEYLQMVSSNKQLYENYHAWRRKELPPKFMEKYNITKTHNVCRTCRWAYSRKYGMGWSHQRQQMLPLTIPRHSCRDTHGLLTWPVRERWFIHESDAKFKASSKMSPPLLCKATHEKPWSESIAVDGGLWKRTLQEHDGVIDLRYEGGMANKAVLELVTPFDEMVNFHRVAPGHLRWQNQTARISVWIHPVHTPIRQTAPHMVHIKDPGSVRIVVEDVDRFHVGAREAENYFGRVMKNDWETPLEAFAIDRLDRKS
jgi:hypothetical protein